MKLLLYFISYFMVTYGLVWIIIYFNLFSFGYSILEYLEFIFKRVECIFFFIGVILFIIIKKIDY
ncbi:MAG: hypothetical protein IJ463_01040 [Bacilli bacterium]|nr:hypothetical protein [Bacilli bacterium]